MRSKIFGLMTATIAVAGCDHWTDRGKPGKKEHGTSTPTDPSLPVSGPTPASPADMDSNPPQTSEEKVLEMSKAELVDFGVVGFKSYYSLGVPLPIQYDDEKKESKLVLTATGFSKTATVEEGAHYRMKYCNDPSRYFFIRRNLNNLPSGREWFKGSDAEVYLKDQNRVIAVGRYLEQFPADETLKRWEKLNYPRLCEGDYASVCRVTVSISGHGNIPGERFQTVFRLYLKDKDQETLFLTASTPITTRTSEDQYFGCDLL